MEASTSLKRKHTTLNIETKVEILNRLQKGESGASLARIYGVGRATIRDLKVKKEAIMNYASKIESDEGPKKRKTLKTAKNTTLEDAVYLWFTERRRLGEPISGPLICEKALDLNKKLDGPPDFKASSGWLQNFKTRHGIRELQTEVPQQAPPGTKQVVAPTPPVKKSLPQVSQPSPKPAITKPAPPRPVSPPQPPPPPPEVCLRWNSYHSNMQATFPSLLNNEQFVDVTLACEGRSIKCHKMMLSACSSYFEELLSQNPCQHPIVLMKDLKFWEVQALVDFMYRGEVNVGQDKLPSLLAAAEALQIKGLAGPASTSSSHDEDSLPPSLPLTADDYLDESTSSPSSARRARKRRTIAALPTPRQNTISPHRNPVGRPRLVRPSPQPSTSTSSYHQASVASEPPLRRARRSEPASLPVGQEIKVEPVDIDISNDSMDPIDDGFDMNKTYDGSSGGGGGGGGGGGSGGGGAGAGAGDVSDTSKQDDEAGGGTEGEITGNLTDDNRAIISGHDSDHMDYGNNNGMNSEATTTQAGRENSIEIQGYSYTEGSSDDPTMSSSDMNMTYPEVVLNPGAENASSDSILGHL
ncbi:protein bric-a-brac 1-like isoform X12 [Periplaneta americana]|uniref:protein bric-a-brac 1-like isoform X12 n=1 Tax=Periplaneta americana TaxID=6978 RepID=UPI0037E9B4C1